MSRQPASAPLTPVWLTGTYPPPETAASPVLRHETRPTDSLTPPEAVAACVVVVNGTDGSALHLARPGHLADYAFQPGDSYREWGDSNTS